MRIPLATLLVIVTACPRPGHLGASCTLPPSSATWTATTSAGIIEGDVRDQGERSPIGNLELSTRRDVLTHCPDLPALIPA